MNYDKIVMEKIGEAISYAIKERGLTEQEVVTQSGVEPDNLNKILNGHSYSILELIRVMRTLQIHLEFSLIDEGNNIFTMKGTRPSQN